MKKKHAVKKKDKKPAKAKKSHKIHHAKEIKVEKMMEEKKPY